MKKNLLLITLILLMTCCSQTHADDNKNLYHDNAGDFYYDYNAVCKIHDELNALLGKEEWDAIHHGQYNTQSVLKDPNGELKLYTYSHDGLEVDYSDLKNPNFWRMYFNAQRLPEYMLSKDYFLSKFNVQNLPKATQVLTLGCDAETITINFKQNKTMDLLFQVTNGAM